MMYLFIGIGLCMITEGVCSIYYGYSALSVVIYKTKYSKRFSWLACNVFGDDDWYYNKMHNNLTGN